MITRIFRVKVHEDLRTEFEEKFSSISVDAVSSLKGFISVSIMKPSKWTPCEYAMITVWEDEASLEAFVGENWNQAFIPDGMEKFISECSVHNYESW